MKKLYAVLLTKRSGETEILPMSLTESDDTARARQESIAVMFPGNEYTVCELCPVSMGVAA